MRYGTRTIAGKRWMSSGYRPKSPMKYGYKYFYLFQACQPTTGKTFELYLPNMSGACFKTFMEEFAKAHPGQTMIMDNAGAHHVKWEKERPDVDIVYLPAYSPDFNPQERLFQEIRKPLKGQIFYQLEDIEATIKQTLELFWEQPDKVSKLTQWHP